ncbi:hypothetical protein KRR26_05360 [Corallococcus sp. M34]|uniref:LVIVD repeat-containing protein n=1 Tax=Citreicoccus inhibens TaxID=2849499 RepID=UPI001C23EE36|nr:hypothetical protein [Citreicoccus inhibens]MBU8895019.1 hypothetical protein [Citreicoccus inhibens]
MKNSLLALTGTVALVVGCGKDSTPQTKAECQLDAIDLSACDRSSLATLQSEGIWNMNLTFDDGLIAPATLRYSPGAPLVIGLAVSSKQVTPDTVFVTSELAATDGTPLTYAFAGCRATSPTHMSGLLRVCRDGALTRRGTFEATRVVRKAGESVGSGVDLVSETPLPRGAPSSVFVSGNYAYVTAREEGLFVYNVSDPAHPVQVAEQKISGETWNDAVATGTTLYVGTNGKGIRICDVADPTQPHCDKTLLADKSVAVESMVLDGNLLYSASPTPNADVIIHDVSTPASPVLVARYTVEGSQPLVGDRPLGLAVVNNKLYVSHWTFGLTVSDVSTPKTPKLVGRFAGPATNSLAVGAMGNRTVAFQGSDSWGGTVLSLDVTTPTSIAQVAQFSSRPEVSVSGMALSGTTLYVANFQDGLRVYDVSTPGAPKLTGYYNTWEENEKRGAAYYEGLAAVRVAPDGRVYGVDTARGMLVFRKTP